MEAINDMEDLNFNCNMDYNRMEWRKRLCDLTSIISHQLDEKKRKI